MIKAWIPMYTHDAHTLINTKHKKRQSIKCFNIQCFVNECAL